jgi:hypothetical protein
MTKEQKKWLVKAVFSVVTSYFIGQIIKAERKVEDMIDAKVDEHFDGSKTG